MINSNSLQRSLYNARGRQLDGASLSDPTTVETKSIETVDNDRSMLLLLEAHRPSRP